MIGFIFLGAFIGRQDVDYWKDRANKNDAAFRLQSLALGDSRALINKAQAINKSNIEANARNESKLTALVERNERLSDALNVAIQRGMEAERNARLWRNKCGGVR
jgi:hypothetical protein